MNNRWRARGSNKIELDTNWLWTEPCATAHQFDLSRLCKLALNDITWCNVVAIFLCGWFPKHWWILILLFKRIGHNYELQARILEKYGPHKKPKLQHIGPHQAQAKSCTEGFVDGPLSTEQVHISKILETLYWSSGNWWLKHWNVHQNDFQKQFWLWLG